MFSIAHGGENCNILRRIFARMRERRGILSPFAAPRAPPPLAQTRRPKEAALPQKIVRGAAACASPPSKGSPPSQESRRAPPRPCGEPPRRFCGAADLAFSLPPRPYGRGGRGGRGGSERERCGGGERGGVNEGERELRRGREGKARRGWGVRTGGGGGARAPFPTAALPAPPRSPRGGRCASPQVRRTSRRSAARLAASLWPHLSPPHFYHASSPPHFGRTSRRLAA